MPHTAYTLVTPSADLALPLIIDSPHSGTQWPQDARTNLDEVSLRGFEDCFVDQMWGHAPQWGATLLAARFPRLYIDPNRSALDIDQALLDAPWPGPLQPSEKTRLGFGLVARLMRGQAVYNRLLTVAEVQARIERFWRPYHQALWQQVDGAHARFGAVWHFNVHSMGDDAYKTLGLPEKPLADFVLGDLDGSTADEATMALVETVLRDHGFSVARNDPFKGVEIIRRSGQPAQNRFALQIEVKKSVYMDSAAYAPHAGFAKVQQALDALVQATAAMIRARA
jgi:N-formylglutamate deformylase